MITAQHSRKAALTKYDKTSFSCDPGGLFSDRLPSREFWSHFAKRIMNRGKMSEAEKKARKLLLEFFDRKFVSNPLVHLAACDL